MTNFGRIQQEVSKISRHHQGLKQALEKVKNYDRQLLLHAISGSYIRQDYEKTTELEKRKIQRKHSF